MLVGCFRIGSSLIHELHASGRRFAVIDFNPHLRDTLVKMGVRCVYGDISHRDTLEHAGVAHARVLIVAVSDDFLRGTSNAKLLADLRHMNPSARIIVVAESVRHAMELYNLGADYVLTPRVLAARETLRVIASLDDADGVFTRLRQEHVDHLHSRTEVLP